MKLPRFGLRGQASASSARGGRLMLYTSIATQIAALARNVLVARFLGPAEFGIAATIILTVAFLDSLSNAGSHNLLVQTKEDEDHRLLGAAHTVAVSRGLITAALLVLVVAPATFFYDLGLPPLSIVLVAVASLVGSFAHKGIKAVQRDNDFTPESLTQLLSELGALAVAIPVAYFTQSHLAIVWGLIARSVLQVAVSHLTVALPFRFNRSRAELGRFWEFGWPLLFNGPLLFLSSQADRIFVSTELGATQLGIYSAVVVLVVSPSTAIMKWLGTTYLPKLSRAYHAVGDLVVKGVVYNYTALLLLLGWLMLCGFACFAPTAIHILYGEKYLVPALVVGLVGGLQILRFIRAWTSTLALAVAASGGILVSTITRFVALPLGYGGVVWLGGLKGLLIGFILGELIALAVSLLIVNGAAKRPRASGLAATTVFFGLGALVIWLSAALAGQLVQLALLFLAASLAGSLALLWAISPPETARLLQKFSPARRRR